MKKLLLLGISFLFVGQCLAAEFSAFVKNRQLHITVMADTCNYHGGQLVVHPWCREDRPTKNLAPFCSMEFYVISTEMACEDDKAPTVISLDLDEGNVASEARVLSVLYQGETVVVPTGYKKKQSSSSKD